MTHYRQSQDDDAPHKLDHQTPVVSSAREPAWNYRIPTTTGAKQGCIGPPPIGLGNGGGTGGDTFVLASAATGRPATNIFRFYGDTDGDVDAGNFLVFGDSFLGINPYDPALDFDGSGGVGAADFLQFRTRFLLGMI